MILYISHVLEVVEKVCAQVVIIYRGRFFRLPERRRDVGHGEGDAALTARAHVRCRSCSGGTAR